MTYDEYIKEAKEKKRLVYRAPLPVKKQRVSQYRYQRNGEVKVYTEEEIHELNKKLRLLKVSSN